MEIEQVEAITGGKYIRTKANTCYHCRYSIQGEHREVEIKGRIRRIHSHQCYREIEDIE